MDTITSDPFRRRGVLLLVVLSMLTLFLMLGAAYLTIATRARKAARAFANNSVAGSAANTAEHRLLDAAFMSVARGVSAKTLSSGTVPYLSAGEDLLGDKYGNDQSLIGRITGATLFGSSNALIQLSTAGLSPQPTSLADLNGRVVTIMLPGLAASTRIIQASGSVASPSLVVAAGPTAAGFPLSQPGIIAALAMVSGPQTTLVINGREFDGDTNVSSDTNEPWDAVDVNNPLLATSGSMSPLSNTGTNAGSVKIDNDGDGSTDSMFVDIGLPSIVDADGREVFPRAAILVTDLDGRLNVNAHGSEADSSTVNEYPIFNANTGTGSAISIPMAQLPRGAPMGPASVSLARGVAFDPAGGISLAKADLPTAGTQLIGGRTVSGANPEYATNAHHRETPRLGAIQGRSGDAVWDGSTGTSLASAAGRPLINDPISRSADWWRAGLDAANNYTAFSYFTVPGRWGSPVDLRGRMRVWVDGFGQPVYYKPSWRSTAFNEVVDDPYEANLTRLGARTGYTITPNGAAAPPDSLFTPADLEGLLRYYDPDSLKLPRRLVALSGTSATKHRLMLTTESWDTPAIVGTAWHTVIGGTASGYGNFLSTAALVSSGSNRPQDLFSLETILGHKMDLNRPFHDVSFDEPNDATGNNATGTLGRRQTFARQLYCLMASIARTNTGSLSATTARKLAQYAVNVVDFRDADSIMTQFFYDPNFSPSSTSWSPGNTDYVWGCERPEVLMTETLAWHDRRTDDLSVGNKCTDTIASTGNAPDDDLDQSRRPWGGFFVELYSPWGSRAYELVSGTVGNVLIGSGTARGEPVPATLTATGTASFDRAGTLSLAKTAPGGAPVWRMVSVLGNVQGGTGFDSSDRIVDPAAANSTAVVDRVFYFTPPPSILSTGTESGGKAAVFWASSVNANPSQSQYVVAGTDNLLFDYHDTFPDPKGNKNDNGYDNDTSADTPRAPDRVALAYTKKVHIRFDMVDSTTSGSGKVSRPVCASLTEPVNVGAGSNGNQDAYELLAEAVHGSNNKFTPDWHAEPHQYDDSKNPISLQNPVDKPLDGVNPASYGLTNISPQVLMADSGAPVLMANGTHDNFAVVHLQRLANPTIAYNATGNPYITVDSLTVDLTVVNTMNVTDNQITNASAGYTKANVDDPSSTQKQYRYRSVERGGRWADTGVAASDPPAHDIWNSRVIASGTTDLSKSFTSVNPSPFVTATTSPRTATGLTTGATPRLQAAPGFGNAADRLTSTFRAYNQDSDGNPITGMPSRFFKNGESEPDSPRFPWLWWANRPFSTVVELAMVPVGSSFELPHTHTISIGGATAPNSLAPAFYHLPGLFEDTTSAPWDAIAGRTATGAPSLFDFVHVPSPFAAVYSTVRSGTAAGIDATNAAALRQLGLDVFPINQISNFREPGRVNVNTIPHAGVWRALFGSITAQGDPDVSNTAADKLLDKLPGWDANRPVLTTLQDLYKRMPNAGESTFDRNTPPARGGGFQDRFVTERDRNNNGVLDAAYDADNDGTIDPNDPSEQAEDLNGNGILDSNDHRDTNRNAYFRYQTMNQLANVTTVRSNVFAIWVTIGYFAGSGTTALEVTPVRRHRGFYIFDRSIPVGYERGKDHNVRDAILLRRIIE
jgi:hypothetical protein